MGSIIVFFQQAFGTMGILFPLVIPTICELELAQGQQCRVDIIVQAAAAIMGSSIFGNGELSVCNCLSNVFGISAGH